jgi:PAS domain S-box-containing protein
MSHYSQHPNARYFIYSAAAFVALSSITVFIGWIFDIHILKGIFPGLTTMKFNTAVVFLLWSGVLFSAHDRRKVEANRKTIFLCIAVFLVIPLLTWVQYTFNVDLGIDQLVFNDVHSTYVFPGRIAHSITYDLMLLGLAGFFIFSKGKSLQRVGQFIAHVVTMLSIAAVFGYLFQLPVFYSISSVTEMALPAALLLFWSSLALGLVREESGLYGVVFGTKLGDRIIRRLLIVIVVSVFTLSVLAFYSIDQRMVSNQMALALLSLLVIGIFLQQSFVAAQALNTADEKRDMAESDYARINQDLERKIRSRTEALEKSFLQIKRSEENFRSILDSAPDALILIDDFYRIQLVNERFVLLCGYTPADVKDLNISAIIPSWNDWIKEPDIHELLESNSLQRRGEFETKINSRFAPRFSADVSLSRIRTNDGQFLSLSIRDITVRKGIQAQLETLAQRLRQATEGTGIGVWDFDVKNNNLFWEDSMYEVYGQNRREFNCTYSNWRALVHRDDWLHGDKDVLDALRSGDKYNSEFRIVLPSGEIKYMKASAVSQRDETGRVVRMIGVNWDITPLKRAEEELILSAERNKIFISQSPTAIAMLDFNFRFLAVSEKWLSDYDLEKSTIMERSIFEVFDTVDPKWKTFYDRCLRGESLHFPEEKSIASDGSLLWTEVDMRPWYKQEGEVGGVLLYTANITKRKEMDALLRLSEERFRGAFQWAAIGMGLLDTTGGFLKANQKLCSMLGYSLEELMHLKYFEVIHPDDVAAMEQKSIELLKRLSDSFQLEQRFIHKSGKIIWVILTGSVVRDNDGRTIQFVAQITDITEQKNAEHQLAETIAKLKGILDASSQVAIITWNKEGLITSFNRGAEHLLGFNAKELVYSATPLIFHKEAEIQQRARELSEQFGRPIEGFDVFVEYAKQGEHETREWTFVASDGTEFPVIMVVTAQRTYAGELIGYLGMAIDITAQKQAEESRSRYAVLESKSKEMEQFAYVASHDLREPLLTIKSYVSILVEDYTNVIDERGLKYTQFIQKAVLRMEDLIRGLLDYSRLGRTKLPEEVAVGQLLSDVKDDLARLIDDTSTEIFIGQMPVLMAYPLELKLLFQNLIANAIKFRQPNESPIIHIQCEALEEYYKFSIEDNGIGIEEKDQMRIFDLFQRLHSKSEFEGTGIGLSQCKKIAEIHNGTIWVKSRVGEGSVFYFTILANL